MPQAQKRHSLPASTQAATGTTNKGLQSPLGAVTNNQALPRAGKGKTPVVAQGQPKAVEWLAENSCTLTVVTDRNFV